MPLVYGRWAFVKWEWKQKISRLQCSQTDGFQKRMLREAEDLELHVPTYPLGSLHVPCVLIPH